MEQNYYIYHLKRNKNTASRAGGMVQQVKAYAALAKDLGLVLNTPVAAHNHL